MTEHTIKQQTTREWVLDWLVDRYGTTPECLESATSLSSVTWFYEYVEKVLLAYDAENWFDITIPDMAFDECDTVDALAQVIDSYKDKDKQNATLAP